LSAARLAPLWALVPGAVLMTPMLDQAVCLPVAAASASLAAAAAASAPRGWGLAVLAGICGAVALFLSYGAAAFLAIGGLAVLALHLALPGAGRRAAMLAGLAAATTAALWLLPALAGHHPWASLRTALAIHRHEYTLPRSYPLWLAFNLVDLAMFLGVPVALALSWRATRAVVRGPDEPADRFALAAVTGVALLLFSGQTRGEVGRLWLPLMPTLLVAALVRRGGPSRGEAVTWAVCLAALTIALAVRWQVP
jgi:hypothetical protein